MSRSSRYLFGGFPALTRVPFLKAKGKSIESPVLDGIGMAYVCPQDNSTISTPLGACYSPCPCVYPSPSFGACCCCYSCCNCILAYIFKYSSLFSFLHLSSTIGHLLVYTFNFSLIQLSPPLLTHRTHD
jgi:hypothetical protein